MSCEAYREKLSEALLHGEAVLSAALANHVRACARCAEFYEGQKRLLGVIDSSVRAMVNEEVPGSLLSGARWRMEEVELARLWLRWLLPTAGVVAMVLLVLVPLVRWRFRTTSQQTVKRGAAVGHEKSGFKPSDPIVLSAHTLKRHQAVKASRAEPETVPQVAILSPEQAAVARFALERPEEMAAAVQAVGPERPDLSRPIEIAPLKIEKIELAPLEVKTENDFPSVDDGSAQF